MKKVVLLLSCLLLSVGLTIAQDKQASGIVIDENNEPVVGASVALKGSLSIGTVTDNEGQFSLSVPANAKTLTVKYIGYTETEVAAGTNVSIELIPDVKSLGEVVVVGYGTQQKKDVTSSIVKINGSDISNLAAPSFESQLAGRAAGVNVVTQNGMVGQAPEFQIRGYSTLSSGSQPLIVIDGIPVNSGQIQQLYGRYNPMADVNPGDIQSIEILKDGAATAIYGSRAANGVVLITTKKGNKNAAKVTYDAYAGFASPVKLHDLLNAEEFVIIANEKYTNWGNEGQAVLDLKGVNTNWNDYVYRTGYSKTTLFQRAVVRKNPRITHLWVIPIWKELSGRAISNASMLPQTLRSKPTNG